MTDRGQCGNKCRGRCEFGGVRVIVARDIEDGRRKEDGDMLE